jgi:ribosome biogenesis GTPase / thiamine phosphate phosphatase
MTSGGFTLQDSLEALGWNSFFAEAFARYEPEGLTPGRVAVQERGAVVLFTAGGPIPAETGARLVRESGQPVTGDWVAAEILIEEDKAIVRAILPRRSRFARKEPWLTEEQVVAANVDTAFLVTDCGLDFNPRRLERYLTAAWDSGAAPVVVLTKADLAADPAATVEEAQSVAFGVPVHAVSSVTGTGLEELATYLQPGSTIALLGSSGVGKSTLANRLLGEDRLATGELRRDGRGRHTTTNRELVRLPGGAFLLDTPGMRELQLWADEGALEETFSDVADLARECRFSDCGHGTEPGCAIRTALEDGSLPQVRWESYRKLQGELRALAIKQDARLKSEVRKERRRFARSQRKTKW